MKLDIVVDTREQKPYWEKSSRHENVTITKLDTGDYSIKGYEKKFAIERKSPADLLGSITSGHKRFRNECIRGQKLEYFAVLVDQSYTDVLNKNWKNSWQTKVKGYIGLSILYTMSFKYNFHIIFANDRTEAKKIIKSCMKAYLKIKEKEKMEDKK